MEILRDPAEDLESAGKLENATFQNSRFALLSGKGKKVALNYRLSLAVIAECRTGRPNNEHS
jgi:hypothetical protein